MCRLNGHAIEAAVTEPKNDGVAATVPHFRFKSAATSAPGTRNETAEILVNGAVSVRQPTRVPTSQATGNKNNVKRPAAAPRSPANSAKAKTGTQTSGLNARWLMPS